MNEWNREVWTKGARNLIDWVSRLDEQQPVMMLIRHSHRDVLKDHQEMIAGGLTNLGKKLSVEMGKRLPINRQFHIFTSIVPRCFETAEAIAQGISEQGGEVIEIDPLPTLVRPEYTQADVWNNLQPNGENVTEFVNRWAAGEFEGIEPFDEFSVRLMDDTLNRLLTVDEPMLHLHVTHDLSLMAAKRVLFDRELKWEDRESYLGGLAVTLTEGVPILFVSGKEEPLRSFNL